VAALNVLTASWPHVPHQRCLVPPFFALLRIAAPDTIRIGDWRIAISGFACATWRHGQQTRGAVSFA